MSDVSRQTWSWGELEPLTRSVVAAFAWRVGDEAQGDLSGEAFIGSMNEAFDTMTTEQITKTAGFSGMSGVHNVMVAALSGLEREHITSLASHLGHLAGDGEAVRLLAVQAGEQLTEGRIYDAIPPLRVLSEMAIERR